MWVRYNSRDEGVTVYLNLANAEAIYASENGATIQGPSPVRLNKAERDQVRPAVERASGPRRIERTRRPNLALDRLVLAWNTNYGSLCNTLTNAEANFVGDGANDGNYLSLTTGGWSGNEDALAAFMRNTAACTATWRLSTVGGLHIFRYVTEAGDE